MNFGRVFCFLLLWCSAAWAQPQGKDSVSPVRVTGVGLHYGSLIAHSQEVQNTAGARPYGLELQFTRQQTGARSYNLCHCYPRQGLLLSAYSFNSEVLGWGAMAAYLLEPSYRLGNRWMFSMRGAAGLAYGSKPYHPEEHPANQSYSTHVSAYLLYGLGLQYQLDARTALQVSANFQHISNGGMKQPNKGVNWPTVGLHLQRYARPLNLYNGSRHKDTAWRQLGWRKDLAIFGMAKRWLNDNGSSSRVAVAGAVLQVGKQVGSINHLSMGLEASYNGTINHRLKADTLAGNSWKLALVGGHEFLLGRFMFSQQLGWYLYQANPYYDRWFHRWGLLYRLRPSYWLGFSLKAHKHVADFVDLRLMYSWR